MGCRRGIKLLLWQPCWLWNGEFYEEELKQIEELNTQLSEAILNGDAEAILDIQEQKSKKIEAIQDKFDKFVDQAAREQNVKKLGTALKYEQQAQKSTADVIEETVSDVLDGNVKINSSIPMEDYFDYNYVPLHRKLTRNKESGSFRQ